MYATLSINVLNVSESQCEFRQIPMLGLPMAVERGFFNQIECLVVVFP